MRSVQISAWYLPVIELAGLLTTAIAVGVGGWWVHTGDAHHRHRHLLRAHAVEPVRAGAAAVASCSTSCSRPAPALNKLFGLLDTAGRRARAPRRRRPARPRRHRRSRASASPTPAARPCSRDVDLDDPGGRAARAGRAHRRRQVDPGQAGRPPLRPDRGRGPLRRRRPARRHAARRCASGSSSCPRRGSSSTARSSTTCAWPGPGATDDEVVRRPRGHRRARALRRPARGARHRGAASGARRLSAGEKQLVSLARAALADPAVLVLDEATSSLDPGTEVAGRARPRPADGGPHGHRHRPPPVDRRAGRPRRGRRRRPPRRAGHPRRARGAGRPLRRPVRHLVRRPAGGIARSRNCYYRRRRNPPTSPPGKGAPDGCHRSRPLQVQARLERRRGLRLQAQAGPRTRTSSARCRG